MEARRNLDNVFKRRFEDSEKKRFKLELSLSVVKVYSTLYSFHIKEAKTQDERKLHERIEYLGKELATCFVQLEIINSAKRRLENTSQQSLNNSISYNDFLQECIFLANLEFENILFQPESFLFSFLVKELFQNCAIENKISESDICLNADLTHLERVVKGILYILNFFKLSFVAIFSCNKNILNILFNNSKKDNNDFSIFYSFFEKMTLLFSEKETTSLNDSVGDVVIIFFICKALLQSMGGDLILNQNNIEIYFSCEIMPNEMCMVKPIWEPDNDKTSVKSSKESSIDSLQIPLLNQNSTTINPNKNKNSTSENLDNIPEQVLDPSLIHSPELNPEKSLSGQMLNILLAEDDPITQKIFSTFWKKLNHNVSVADNGQQALELFKTNRFSIIFLDIEIPIKSGIIVTKEIRAMEKENNLRKTPIIGASGYAFKSYAEAAYAAGMDEFVQKPYYMKQMLRVATKYCAV